jgi:hypothetical protein
VSELRDKIAAARAEGYTDTEIYLGLKPKLAAAVAEGYREKEVLGFLGLAPVPGKYGVQFERAAKQYGLDPLMLYSVAQAESGGRPDAVGEGVVVPGPRADGKIQNARGIMQLMPDTAKALGVKDPTNPDEAIPAAAKLLRQNLDRYGGDVEKALLSYHGGYDETGWGPKTRAYPTKVYRAWQSAGGAPIFSSIESKESLREPGEANWNWFQSLGNGYLQGFGVEASAAGQVLKTAWERYNAQRPGQPGMGPIEAIKSAMDDFPQMKSYYEGQREQYARENPVAAPVTELGGMVVGQAPLLAATGLPALAAAAGRVANPVLRIGARLATGGLEGAASGILGAGLTDAPIEQDMTLGALGGAAFRGVAAPAASRAWNATFGTGNITPTVARTALDMSEAGGQIGIGQVPGAGVVPQLSSRIWQGKPTAGPEFRRALAATIGENTDEITMDTIRAAKDRLGPELGRLAAPYTVDISDNALLSGLSNVRQAVRDTVGIPASDARKITRMVQNIETELVSGGLSGSGYRDLVKKGAPLDSIMNADNPTVATMGQRLRTLLEESFERVMPPAVRQQYVDTRLAYRNTWLLQGAVDDATGQVNVKKLAGAVARSYGDRPGVAGDFGALVQGQNMLQSGPAGKGMSPLMRAGLVGGALATGAGGVLHGWETLLPHLTNPAVLYGAGGALAGTAAASKGADIMYRMMTNELLRNAASMPRGTTGLGRVLNVKDLLTAPLTGTAAPGAAGLAARFGDAELPADLPNSLRMR